MSAFGIFALILTTAYIIYFSVVIIRDVTSSRKSAEENSGAETFDTTFAGEQSVEVIETETGFAVGDNNVNAEPVAAAESIIPETPVVCICRLTYISWITETNRSDSSAI